MKILVDINHPAHVHYFRNFIKSMKKKGHEFIVVSRNKEIEHQLLDYYNIKYTARGDGSSKFGKIGNLLKTDYLIYKLAKKFNPDLFLSFMHPYPAQIAWYLNKPSIVLSDTEVANLHKKLTLPFASKVITPTCFKLDFGKKHVRFSGFMELFYLHPNYFSPNPNVLNLLNIKNKERYVVIRFISWKAVHDIGHKGLTQESKLNLVKAFIANNYKVFISSEDKLPYELKKYKLNIHPGYIHSVLYYASLFVGESATMSTESALLGVPSIQLRHRVKNDKLPGVHIELKKKGLKVLMPTNNVNNITQKSLEILKTKKIDRTKISELIYKDWCDPNHFLCKIIFAFIDKNQNL